MTMVLAGGARLDEAEAEPDVLPSLEFMRGYLVHYADGGPVLDATALGWLATLISEVAHLRTTLAELNVTPSGHELTRTEVKVLRLLRNTNMTMSEIASAMWVSTNTTKSHAKHIYGKLGVHRRRDLRDLPLA